MKKIFSILATAAALCAVACTENTPEEASLSVDPTQIEFTAENAAATNVTVTAVGTGWNVSVTETASGWLTAEKIDDKTVTVTADNNTTAEQRIGAVIVTPDNEELGKKEITVLQAGSENPVVYDLQLSKTMLEFEPEGAEAQTVTVTVSGEMGWKAEAAEGCAEWVTVTSDADSFSVKVGDNPDTKERIGSVVVTPDNESAEPKEVTIKQKPKVLPPSLSVDKNEVSFMFSDASVKSIMVTAVNCDWDIEIKDENDNTPEWLHVNVSDISLTMTVDANPDLADRIAYVDIVADEETVDDIRITVMQEGFKEHFTELTGDVEISQALKNHVIYIYPNNEWESDDATAMFDMRFFGDGLEHDSNQWPPYVGTGACMDIKLYAQKIVFNGDNTYELPAGEYTVKTYDDEFGTAVKEARTVAAGTAPGWNPNNCNDTWYYNYENSTRVLRAPVVAGTLTVKRNGENYILTVAFEDDLGFKLTGTYEGPLTILCTTSPSEPPSGGAGGENPDPGFGI